MTSDGPDPATAKARDIVLVVDDSPGTLNLLTDALEEANVTVLVATDGLQALELVERITPDVILLDAMMPGIDGFETCRRLKRNGALAHVPIIFMTALSDSEHIVLGLEAGGVDYVTKPIILDELLARIRVHLANARSARSAGAALDAAGRYLLAVDGEGTVLWSTPQAIRLLEGHLPLRGGKAALPEDVAAALLGSAGYGTQPSTNLAGDGEATLQLAVLGRIGENEILLRLTSAQSGDEGVVLRQRFGLTARESEVLVWIARGKPNRDIADILGLSPRTVNKHLEQIYVKLGVENRASAAVLASRALGES